MCAMPGLRGPGIMSGINSSESWAVTCNIVAQSQQCGDGNGNYTEKLTNKFAVSISLA